MSRTSSGADLLALEQITRDFGPVRALDQASLQVRAGTVHALLGENGAGKSTLMRVAFGMLQADAGTQRWQGTPVHLRSPADAMRLGIGMVHQHFSLVGAMTVAENVALGGHGLFSPAVAAERVRTVAQRAALTLDPSMRVDDLSVGAQQRCEIVKALARDARLLILDEPTAVLAPAEARDLLRWIRQFADAGNAVVLITHKLRDAMATADDVTVLHRGRTVLAGRMAETSEQQLALAMFGAGQQTSVPDTVPLGIPASRPSPDASPVLALADVHWDDARRVTRVRNASLHVHAGEMVGIAGVEGAGQQEVLRLLAGRLTPQRGTVTRPESVGFVPEDRHRDALMLDAPLHENLALRGAGRRRGIMSWSVWREQTSAVIAAFDVRVPRVDARARLLSGGNQQKFVLGRELRDHPKAVVVENPSRGLDQRATRAVQEALRASRDSGAAVLMYSSDLDELLALVDRLYVMYAGTLTPVPLDRDVAGRVMLGGDVTERGL